MFKFKKMYATVENSRHFTSLLILKAVNRNDQFKFSSNEDLELKAKGIIKDLVF